MKNYVFLLTLLFLFVNCGKKELSPTEMVTQYFHAFDNGNFNSLRTLIGDSISITEGDYVSPFSREGFHEHFKWDSIFHPTYKVIDIEDANGEVIATVSSYSPRYEFLKNNPLTCKHKFRFESGKISTIEIMECLDADWETWEKERDSLVSWINIHHPKLDGFIYDLSMKGAINYMKAIELYKKEKTP